VRIDVNSPRDDWLKEMKIWRTEHLIRMGYDDADTRPELLWRRKISSTQMMAEDRYFYDPVAENTPWTSTSTTSCGATADRRVLIWYVYTNIGIDDRNQTELGRDLPGGVAGFKGAIADFHRRGVKVSCRRWAGTRHARPRASTGTPLRNWRGSRRGRRERRHLQRVRGNSARPPTRPGSRGVEPESPPQADEGLM